MTKTLDEQLREKGYRPIATFDRSELFQRVNDEIPGLAEMDYFILPVVLALGEEPMGKAYEGLHYIYARKGSN